MQRRGIVMIGTVAAATLAAWALAACSSDGTADPGTTGAGSTAAGTTLPGATTSVEVVDLLTTTSASDTTSTVTVTTAEPVEFHDPNSQFTIDIDPTWEKLSGLMSGSGVEFGILPTSDAFRSNITITTQAAQGRDLQTFLEYSLAHMGSMTVIKSGTVAGKYGNPLGYVEFAGQVAASGVDQPLHFMSVFGEIDGTIVIATLGATDANYPTAAKVNGPLLLTLQPV